MTLRTIPKVPKLPNPLHLLRSALRETWGILLLFAAWEIWAATSGYNPIIIVGPVTVLRDLLHHPSVYLRPTLWTLAFALSGLALGTLSGILLAILGWASGLLRGLMHPAALLVSSTPVVCLIPLLARIFGYRSRTELVTVAVMTFFPAFIYAGAGLRDAPPMSRQLFTALGASRLQQLRLLALPAALPSVAVALRVGAALSVLVTVVAEFLMQTGGLGALFAVTMQQFHLARALGTSLVAMALSVTLYELAGALETRTAARWSSRS